MLASLRQQLRDPVVWSNASQVVKTVIAVVIAWALAVHVFHVAQPFLAPWAALLTVHMTVYRSLRRGIQQVGATIIGVLLAFAAGTLLGVNALSLGLAVLAGLIAGSVRGLRAETTTAAATAIVVLTTGYSEDSGMLLERLLDTSVGIVVGLLVNLLVWPPLRDRSAAHQIDVIDDRLGELMREMASALRGDRAPAGDWIARTDELDDDIDEAWSVLGQARESGRLNPRLAARQRMRAAEAYDEILRRLAQTVAELRSMARTIKLARVPPAEWDRDFRAGWLELLDRAGTAVCEADVATIEAVRADLEAFAAGLDPGELSQVLWPVCGALVVNLRNILASLDAVADAQPVAVPAPAWTASR